jgi:hypothetical protein
MKKETMKTKALQTLAVMGIASIAFAGAASASTFTVYATGYTAGYGSEIAPTGPTGTADGNFTIVGVPSSPTTILTVSDPAYVLPSNQYPVNNYFPDNGAGDPSEWIAPQDTYQTVAGRGSDPVGEFEYQTTFSLAGYDPTSAVLNGVWGTDNTNVEILLNGTEIVGPSGSSGYITPSSYSYSGSLLNGGENTIDFIVENTGGPTAFTTFAQVTANVTPEPSPLVALGVGVLGVGMMMVRKRRIS